MNISVLGCGRWGAFIAWYLNKTGHDVMTWGLADAPQLIELKETRSNGMLTFPESLEITSDLEKAVKRAEVIVISISCQALRSFLADVKKYDLTGKSFVLCMKGIEEKTGCRLSQIVKEVLGDVPVAVWVGPGHPQNFVAGVPNCMVIDSDDEELKKKLVGEFSSELIRFYFGTDLIGSEVGAAAKNVIGIAAGMLDGYGYGCLKGALMSRGTFPRMVFVISVTTRQHCSHNSAKTECSVRSSSRESLIQSLPRVLPLAELWLRCLRSTVLKCLLSMQSMR